MDCFDCTAAGRTATAVAVCTGCGAAVCPDHAVVTARYLTRESPIGRIETVDVPTRSLHCRLCAAAIDARVRPVARPARRKDAPTRRAHA